MLNWAGLVCNRRSLLTGKTTLACALAVLFLMLAPSVGAQESPQPTVQTSDRRHFTDDDRRSMRAWYSLHHDELPLGVRKKDRLPRDLESQLAVNEVLPEILRPRVHEVSSDFLVRVQPAADGCHYVFIGGHAVILKTKTFYVYDVFHFEKKK